MRVIIYRCSRKAEMYLYVAYDEDEHVALRCLPAGLETLTGKLTSVMQLELSAGKKLARVNVADVINSIHDKGFYIQMPPNALLMKDQSMLLDPSDSF